VVPEPIRPRRYAAAELKRRVFEQRGHPIQETGTGLFSDLEGASTAPLQFAEQLIPASARDVDVDELVGGLERV
jgi:hypothetical protein